MHSRLVGGGLGLVALVLATWLLVSGQRADHESLAFQQPVPTAAAPLAGVSADQRVATGSFTAAPINAAPDLGDAALVSASWADGIGQSTGIPDRAVLGYAGASLRLAREAPSCRLGWTTLAAIGAIESGHGTHGGSSIAPDGVTRPGILGPELDGDSVAAISDTDGGRSDGSTTWDRAVGPLQFIPATWQRWGADGNRDGAMDAQQIDDAALAAGRYLCSYGDLSAAITWRTALFAYNHLDSYVDSVAATANLYAAEAG